MAEMPYMFTPVTTTFKHIEMYIYIYIGIGIYNDINRPSHVENLVTKQHVCMFFSVQYPPSN